MSKKGNSFGRALFILGIIAANGFMGAREPGEGTLRSGGFRTSDEYGGRAQKALVSGQPVLVDFGANKCIPCRQLRPILKDVVQNFPGKRRS